LLLGGGLFIGGTILPSTYLPFPPNRLPRHSLLTPGAVGRITARAGPRELGHETVHLSGPTATWGFEGPDAHALRPKESVAAGFGRACFGSCCHWTILVCLGLRYRGFLGAARSLAPWIERTRRGPIGVARAGGNSHEGAGPLNYGGFGFVRRAWCGWAGGGGRFVLYFEFFFFPRIAKFGRSDDLPNGNVTPISLPPPGHWRRRSLFPAGRALGSSSAHASTLAFGATVDWVVSPMGGTKWTIPPGSGNPHGVGDPSALAANAPTRYQASSNEWRNCANKALRLRFSLINIFSNFLLICRIFPFLALPNPSRFFDGGSSLLRSVHSSRWFRTIPRSVVCGQEVTAPSQSIFRSQFLLNKGSVRTWLSNSLFRRSAFPSRRVFPSR